MATNNKFYLFNDQVWENMFWSLGFGPLISACYEIGFMWAYANGIAPYITFADNPIWFIAMILIVPFWSSTHFYMTHRAIHQPFLYKHIHYIHHKNTNNAPWSGHAMHPLEHLILFSDSLIFLILASNPIHIIYSIQFHVIGAITSHTGYQKLKLKDDKTVDFGDYFHQLHHKFFDCNYGALELPYDKWFGSFHDGSEAGDELIKQRRKKLRK